MIEIHGMAHIEQGGDGAGGEDDAEREREVPHEARDHRIEVRHEGDAVVHHRVRRLGEQASGEHPGRFGLTDAWYRAAEQGGDGAGDIAAQNDVHQPGCRKQDDQAEGGTDPGLGDEFFHRW